MSDSVEMISKIKEEPVESSSSSNEVPSPYIEGKAEINSTCKIGDIEGYRREKASNAVKYIGKLAGKEFNGKVCIGKVEAYDVKTGLFKIEYDNGKTEKEDENELVKLIRTYINRMAGRKIQNRRTAARARAINAPDLPRQKAERKTKKKTGSSAKKPSTYVPLAIREKKKDAYYWYY